MEADTYVGDRVADISGLISFQIKFLQKNGSRGGGGGGLCSLCPPHFSFTVIVSETKKNKQTSWYGAITR